MGKRLSGAVGAVLLRIIGWVCLLAGICFLAFGLATSVSDSDTVMDFIVSIERQLVLILVGLALTQTGVTALLLVLALRALGVDASGSNGSDTGKSRRRGRPRAS